MQVLQQTFCYVITKTTFERFRCFDSFLNYNTTYHNLYGISFKKQSFASIFGLKCNSRLS